MIPGFPAPYPDELIGSLFARATRHTGLSWKQLARSMRHGSGQNYYISWLMSGPLIELSQHARTSPEDLLWKHTMFPYATAFLSREATKTLETKALVATHQRGRPLVPLTQSVTQGVAYRRYCPVCAKADRRQWGETYWHRSHNLPGVHRCHSHGVPLHETVVPVHSQMHRPVMSMPEEVGSFVKHFPLGTDLLADIARRSVALLDRAAPASREMSLEYRRRLLELKFGDARYAASTDFALRLQQFYGRAFLQLVGASFVPAAAGAWPKVLPRPGNRTEVGPCRHVLFQTFLALSRPFDGSSARRPPGPKPRATDDLDRRLCERLATDLKSPSTAAWSQPLRVWMQGVGCWGTFRHRRHELPATAKIVREIAASKRAQRSRAVREVSFAAASPDEKRGTDARGR